MNLIDAKNFEKTVNGKQVSLYTLKNSKGLVTQVTNYGGRVVNLWVKDKNGSYEDIVLGHSSIDGYLNSNEIYLGAAIGRFGNRIANGKFTLNDSTYTLATNNDPNNLHGGDEGYNNAVWDAKQISDSELELSYLSVDGEEGFPGNLNIVMVYALTEDNELKITYKATTDKATPVNLTHHSFFNLHGAGKGTINDHVLQMKASHYTPVNVNVIPTGEIAPVANTPFDFTSPTVVGDRVDDDNEQLRFGIGYDHNFVVDGSGLRLAAVISEPVSGRVMEVLTDEPGMQFYGGNFLNSSDTGKDGMVYHKRAAFCLESQHYPDSPNQPNFPTCILEPGDTYSSTCIYKFKVSE